MFTRILCRWIISLLIAVAFLAVINTLLTQPTAQAQKPRLAAAIRYVAHVGDDANNHCNNNNRPCATMQHAIDEANDGDEVRIATGIYTDVQVREAVTQVAYISKSLIVEGGYTTTDWLNSNPSSHPTTLDAQGRGRVLTIIGEVTVTIAGFTITGGDALGLGGDPVWGLDAGGGALIISAAVTLSRDIVADNHAHGFGGGIYAQQPLTILESDFLSNTVDFNGGGAYIETAVAITGSRFVGNRATQGCGGGIGCDGTVIVVNSLFENNWSYGPRGGGINANLLYLTNTNFISNASAYGGGAYCSDAFVESGRFERNAAYLGGGLMAKSSHIRGALFLSNTSRSNGGGLYARTAELTSVRLENNRAGQTGNGGGLYAERLVSITRASFISNVAPSGGGLYLAIGGGGQAVNTLFAHNTAAIDGAAIAVVSTGSLTLLHTTIADTDLNPKAAVVAANGRLNLTNTIITSHTIAINSTGGTVYEDYNLFSGNMTNTAGSITSGGHSLIGNPNFVDPFHDDYHLRFPSPAIDHGINAGVYTDLDGNPRPEGAGFDIGAYEYPSGNRYVATTGTDISNNCLDEAAPCATVQQAIDVANAGEQVLIAAGLYTQSATLYKPVSVTGVNSATTIIHAVAGQRVLTVTGAVISNSVVISGLTFTGGDVISLADCPASCGGGIALLNMARPRISNIIIQSNRAAGGGGIYVEPASWLLIDNSQLISNTAGGGGGIYAGDWYTPSSAAIANTIFLSNSATDGGGFYINGFVSMADVYFENNTAVDLGGGLYTRGGLITATNSTFISNSNTAFFTYDSPATVINSRFERNSGGIGGGLWAYYVGATISHTDFISNVVSNAGGGLMMIDGALINSRFEDNASTCCGGGAYTMGTTWVTNTDFVSNTAQWAGGGAYFGGAFIFDSRFEGNTSVDYSGGGLLGYGLFLSNTHILSNSAMCAAQHPCGGGGVYDAVTDATITNSRFENNHTYNLGNGGGLYIYRDSGLPVGSIALTNTLFMSNSANGEGGGVYLGEYNYDGASNASLSNILLARNAADHGAAAVSLNLMETTQMLHTTIASAASVPFAALEIHTGTLNLINTIITSHTIAISNSGGAVYEDYNLFSGNVTNALGPITSGGHSLIGNPNFVDPLNSDYHLRFPSPAIDRGVDAGVYTDLDGSPRPAYFGFDIGAYEYHGPIASVLLPVVRK